MYHKTFIDVFSHILKMVTPRALKQFLLFIALNCLNDTAFIATYVNTQLPFTTKLASNVPQNVHFKIRCCIDTQTGQ